jgi:transposase
VIIVMLCAAAGVFPFPCSRPQNRVIMSVQPKPWPVVPVRTVQVARAAFPGGSLAIRVRDQLGAWCPDEAFAAVYGKRGAPGISPAQLAMVTLLQYAENLTDRQAADGVRGRLDWKYCLGLELTDPGFDFSVLSEFRSRVTAGGMEKALLDLLLARLKGLDLVGAGMRQRTDSTHVLARVRDLNRLELAGESVRAALEAMAAAVPDWLAGITDASWQLVYGQRIDDMRLPESKARRTELALQYARDGYWLVQQAWSPAAPPQVRDLPAVRALRLVMIQQFCRSSGPDGEKVTWRDDEQGLPPGRTRIVSPYDLDARYGEKRGMGWLGYKGHFSETVSDPAQDDPVTGAPARPNLLTHTQTTHAAVPDVMMTQPIHDGQQAAGLLPGVHAVDQGYTSAELLIQARASGIVLLGPLPADASRQARAGGYTADMFTIDWDARQVTCPQGQTASAWYPCQQHDRDSIVVKFPAAACRGCPARGKCTTSAKGRQLTLRPREIHQVITAARAEQATARWRQDYKIRAGAEGTMAQVTHVTGIRRARYAGLPKTAFQHNAAAAAINLIRLDAWWTATPLERARTSHFQRLHLSPAA